MSTWLLSKTFDFEGRIVRWDVQGEGAPLVIVHGTPWSSFNLRHLIKGLANRFQVYYFDLLGYGQSDQKGQDVSLRIQNRLMAALLNYWELENPIAVGHDFGGTTVLRTLLLEHKKYQKLILIDPVAISPWGSPFFKHVNQYEKAFAGLPDYIHRAVVEAYIKTAAHQPLPEATIDGILQPWLSAEGKAAFYRQIAQANSGFTDEVQTNYSSIDIPTLILWGAEDTWIPLEKGRQLAKLIPTSTLQVIPDSGHLVIEEKPTALLEAMQNFL